MLKNTSRNICLDFVRGLAVVFVVFIHIRFPGVLGTIAADFGCLCNALFFLLSGYFAYNNSENKLLRKAIRCFAICFVTYLCYSLCYGDSIVDVILDIPNIVLANIAHCGNMWFAIALSYVYCFYIILRKYKYNYLIVVLLLAISFMFGGICPPRFYNIFQSFTYGLPLFILGSHIAEHKSKLFDIGEKWLIISGIGLVLNFSNVIGEELQEIHTIGSIIYSTGIFLWAITSKKQMNANSILVKIGEKYFLWFFVLQYLTINLVRNFVYHFMDRRSADWFLPFVVIVCLYFESMFVCWVKRKIKRPKNSVA